MTRTMAVEAISLVSRFSETVAVDERKLLSSAPLAMAAFGRRSQG